MDAQRYEACEPLACGQAVPRAEVKKAGVEVAGPDAGERHQGVLVLAPTLGTEHLLAHPERQSPEGAAEVVLFPALGLPRLAHARDHRRVVENGRPAARRLEERIARA